MLYLKLCCMMDRTPQVTPCAVQFIQERPAHKLQSNATMSDDLTHFMQADAPHTTAYSLKMGV